MKNTIEFYYNIRINELHNSNDKFFFNIGNNKLVFEKFDGNINLIEDIYKLNYQLQFSSYVDHIIPNRYNNPLTKINGNFYVLIIKNNLGSDGPLSLNRISMMAKTNINNIKVLERDNWEMLWENKIDYFEMQIGQNEKKYPLIRESIDYFIGLGENAISYLVNTKNELKPTFEDRKVLSHNSLGKDFSNPTNIILDHPARDVAEYIKLSFFNKNYNIFKELDEYFYYNHYSAYGIRVLFARILYPSLYFDLYDSIVSGKNDEKMLSIFTTKTHAFEEYLYKMYLYFSRYYNIPEVEWLKKREINPRLQL